MKQPKKGFILGRLKGITYALKGMWILISTEDSIKAQLFFAVLATVLGVFFDISATEWMIQFLVIGLVLVAEALNTAIEEIANFVHPNYHKKIGFIKDIAAGAPAIAAIISLIIGGIIYLPKIMKFF